MQKNTQAIHVNVSQSMQDWLESEKTRTGKSKGAIIRGLIDNTWHVDEYADPKTTDQLLKELVQIHTDLILTRPIFLATDSEGEKIFEQIIAAGKNLALATRDLAFMVKKEKENGKSA